jgi:hypothetical protein
MAVADFLNPLISAASGLSGVFLGGWLTNRREQKKQRSDFITRQLSEFYGPLVSMRTEIRARGELRLKIETAMNEGHMRNLLNAGQYGYQNERMEATARVTDEAIPPMLAVMRDEFKIFTDVLMPLYRKMLETFRDKIWLADTETRQYLPALIEFVDVWERHIRGVMPDEVVREIKHTEENLRPFYDHLTSTHDRLRDMLTA